jgi:polyhydroxybutyrate depolymerase
LALLRIGKRIKLMIALIVSICFIPLESYAAEKNAAVKDVFDSAAKEMGEAMTDSTKKAIDKSLDQSVDKYKKDQRKKLIRNGIVLGSMKKRRERRAAKKAELREGMIEKTIMIAGQKRNYFVYVPQSYDENKTYALVFVLHGHGLKTVKDIALHMIKLTKGKFNELAETENFIVVYPNAYNAMWNDGRPYSQQESDNADDILFFKTMTDDLLQEYSVDSNRIYSTGFSNGGLMSYRLACDLSDTFAAVGNVASTLSVEEYAACKPSEPVSVMMLNGVDDPLIPWAGGKMGKRGEVKSSNETRDLWKTVDGCSDEFQSFSRDNDPKDKTSIEGEIYDHCANGLGITVYNIHGGGHTWPGGVEDFPKVLVGLTTKEIDGTQAIWDFFKAHPKK